ncbi:MAG: site-specific integrase [Candidatus Bathyarchaeota archaeon]|nr:site-specific integrase [Candidatus Bathyarchaeota archaeon]MDH5495730.1 site-specific integrase [Candidatus Bathyarchaeota archaeon]MDH5733661.1 site-specific integrase [Candidatus Bathyarchaeota archaeon]
MTQESLSSLEPKIIKKLANPRIEKIHFHTLRHWKATMEYHKTKDILHVKQLLGHRSLDSTLIYTQLVHFPEDDEWHVAHAKTLEEEGELIKQGFEFVRFSKKHSVAIYRKRK